MPDLSSEIEMYTKAVACLQAVPLADLEIDTKQAIKRRISRRIIQLQQATSALKHTITTSPAFHYQGGC